MRTTPALSGGPRTAARPRASAPLGALARRILSARQTGALPATGLLVLRVGTGILVAWLHGLHKVQDGIAYLATGRPWPLVGDVVALGLPAPVPFATLAVASQLVGGILVALGFLTRPAAAAIAITMGVAVWVNVVTGGPDAQLAGLYGLAALSLAFLGGGRYSLDRMWPQEDAR